MTVPVRGRSYDDPVAKTATQFACTDCGYSAGRWFGKCPQCGEFGTLLYCGIDWVDPVIARRSMELMAEVVMPAVNRHLATATPLS